jgi:2-dehydropantoate 2-reductase
MKNPRIVVIGAGAVGGVMAAVLKKSGYDITMVVKYPELATKISSEGVHVFGKCGDLKIQIPCVVSVSELEGIIDFAFIATKGYDMPAVAKDLLPFLNEDSRVVSLQNGICEEELAKIVGKHRTIGCVVGWGATMHEPGVSEMTSTGEFIIGNWEGQEYGRLREIMQMLNRISQVKFSNNIFSELYSKLIVNSCITTLGAISGMLLGEMLLKKKARNIFIRIIIEAMAVADAMQLDVPPYAGKLDYYKFRKKGFLSGIRRHVTILVIGFKYRKLKSSSLQSLERGKKTEVDYYNGYITAKGIEYGVETPVNKKLTEMVKEIEDGKRKISSQNFKVY